MREEIDVVNGWGQGEGATVHRRWQTNRQKNDGRSREGRGRERCATTKRERELLICAPRAHAANIDRYRLARGADGGAAHYVRGDDEEEDDGGGRAVLLRYNAEMPVTRARHHSWRVKSQIRSKQTNNQ